MNPSFWNDRFGARSSDYVYGTAANRFIARESERLSPGVNVLELGAGEGRNAVFLAERGFSVTALDYAGAGLDKTRRLAEARGVAVETIKADVTTWQPDRQWEAVVIAFLHLPAARQPVLYRRIRQALRPGGLLIAEWFHPRQVTEGYESGGPPAEEMMVTLDDLADFFDEEGVLLAEEVETTLNEGPHHEGPAAVTRLVWRRPMI